MPVLSKAERREKIINYILLHQGCSKEEAYDTLKDMISRNTFFKDLPKLVKEGKITVKSKNKRDTMLFVDKNNPLIYVPNQLEDFERAYAQLLEKSTKRIKEKDFSEIAHILGITEIDPIKWSVDDLTKFIQHERRMVHEHAEHIRKFRKKLGEVQNHVDY